MCFANIKKEGRSELFYSDQIPASNLSKFITDINSIHNIVQWMSFAIMDSLLQDHKISTDALLLKDE